MPTHHGHELAPGDDVGADTTPDCCDNKMTEKMPRTGGHRYFTCDTCETAMILSPKGLVVGIAGV